MNDSSAEPWAASVARAIAELARLDYRATLASALASETSYLHVSDRDDFLQWVQLEILELRSTGTKFSEPSLLKLLHRIRERIRRRANAAYSATDLVAETLVTKRPTGGQWEILESLTPRDLMLIALRTEERLSNEQIAQRLRVSVATIYREFQRIQRTIVDGG